MGETKIEWADNTENIWIGCLKVSAACSNCYAENDTPTRVLRSRGLKLWGPAATAVRYETKGWEKSLRALNRKAQREGRRRRVFINSLADFFEAFDGNVMRLHDMQDGPAEMRPSGETLADLRARAFTVFEECTSLDILLLTKRPENVRGMVPGTWLPFETFGVKREWPRHVWIGATVEDQAMADERIPHLLGIPAAVRFLSVEPMLGPVDLRRWLRDPCDCMVPSLEGAGQHAPSCKTFREPWGIQWCIVGGESGPNARPMEVEWVRSIRDQCRHAGTACFVKQMGTSPSGLSLLDKKGGDMAEWPEDLRVREVPA